MLEKLYPLLLPTIKMMNAFSVVITDMEKAGCTVNLKELQKIEDKTKKRHIFLVKQINLMIEQAVGDVKINIDSPEQLSQLIYSIKVIDKKAWLEIFNLGTETRNSVSKKKRMTFYNERQLKKIIKEQTTLLIKQKAEQCKICKGKGRIKRRKKDGTEAKHPRLCSNTNCNSGVVYTDLKGVGGFNCIPLRSSTATAGGFGTGAAILEELIKREKNEKTRKFLSYLVEFGKLSYNLNTNIDGVRRAIREGTTIHSSFNQTVAATGRLSSTSPNIHNWQRGDEFPIRRIITSRWPGGKITKGDFSGLEFRIAVELSKDEQGFKDLAEGIDAHGRTRDILAEYGQHGSRQDAKVYTFKPLYGGTSGTPAQQAYYKFFYKQYPGILAWHEKLETIALSKGRIIIPSGRIYKFTGVKRYPSGYVSRSTQIKNYPVQGFATGDIVPITTIECWRQLKDRGLRSVIINEVHDEIDIDTHPDELDIVPKVLYNSMMMAKELLLHWYNYKLVVDLPVEIQQGPNWLDVEEIKV